MSFSPDSPDCSSARSTAGVSASAAPAPRVMPKNSRRLTMRNSGVGRGLGRENPGKWPAVASSSAHQSPHRPGEVRKRRELSIVDTARQIAQRGASLLYPGKHFVVLLLRPVLRHAGG